MDGSADGEWLLRNPQKADFLNRFAFAVHRRMDIQLQRGCNIHMAQHFTDAFYINSLFNAPRRIAMAERMVAVPFQTAAPQDSLKVVLICARLHRLVFSSCQNISILRQTRNSFFQICHHIVWKWNNAHRFFALWCLNDELRFPILTDTLNGVLNADGAVLKVNI